LTQSNPHREKAEGYLSSLGSKREKTLKRLENNKNTSVEKSNGPSLEFKKKMLDAFLKMNEDT
jgi:hypothetical protein